MTSAGLGQRLADSWGDRHYPNQNLDAPLREGAADNPRWRQGAVTGSKRGRVLAILTEKCVQEVAGLVEALSTS